MRPVLDSPVKVAKFQAIYNAAGCPEDVGRLMGLTLAQVHNCREWCRKHGIPLKRFRAKMSKRQKAA